MRCFKHSYIDIIDIDTIVISMLKCLNCLFYYSNIFVKSLLNFQLLHLQFSVDSLNTANMANATTDQSNPAATEISNVVYRPVYKHWFYNKTVSDQKPTWTPFPMNDSLNLEEAYASNSNQFITTNGGRYDVNIENRTRSPIYWNGASDEVRRCSWFYKGADSRLVPYDECVSDLLEEEYRMASQSGEWNRKITIPSGEVVVFQAPSVIVHFLAAQTPDLWPNATIPVSCVYRFLNFASFVDPSNYSKPLIDLV